MKQISINEVLDAFGDEPASIGDRLEKLGYSQENTSKFSSDLLNTKIYASSFVKFLQDNKKKLAAEVITPKSLPDGWKDPYQVGELSVLERLVAMGFAKDEFLPIFDSEVLDLKVTPDEFQNLLKGHEAQIFEHMYQQANQDQ